MDEGPVSLRRLEYRPPDYLVDRVDLKVALHGDGAVVEAVLEIRRRVGAPGDGSLVLNGVGLALQELTVDGASWPSGQCTVESEELHLSGLPESCTVATRVRIHPEHNTSLEGFYRAASGLCLTQCEAHGFRKITWFPDRPDVLARYRVTLEADKGRYPVLLSNGNPVGAADLAEGRHRAVWEDPFPKPCYLFAMVFGDLEHVEQKFTTASGRRVTLRIFTEARNRDRCGHAMASLVRAMEWDEQTFGLECDLDHYNVVATDDFNMGAMENKGLNIFNSKYVLARPDTATDGDFHAIEGVIGHEYFHNWTGNRVTCRDWFQLSLKEGLTVFRDQQFSAAMGSPATQRIADVRTLRLRQFAEDRGPMAHPVRPDEVVEINNFYTATVYEKGAEVVRMLHTLIGPENFRAGLRRYLREHDGGAATCEDFVAAMAAASGRDLQTFLRWYSQAGTPELRVTCSHDAAAATCTLTFEQHTAPTPGQEGKEPVHIPVRMGLLSAAGKALPLRLRGESGGAVDERVLEITGDRQSFTFEDIPQRPLPSLLRGFSAPVRLEYPYSSDELALLMARDVDPFCRWDAGQRLCREVLLELIAHRQQAVPDGLVAAFAAVLADRELDRALAAAALVLPSEAELGECLEAVDVEAVHRGRNRVRAHLASALGPAWRERYDRERVTGPYRYHPADVAARQLANLCLGWLALGADDEGQELCRQQFEQANNMTDRLAALSAIVHNDHPAREQVLARFEEAWRHEPLVMDKWLSIQATVPARDTLPTVRRLMEHPVFTLKNPNRVRALIGAFAQNLTCFHAADGSGYRFLADQVLALDPLNPQVAARMISAFNVWRRHEPGRRDLMRTALEDIQGTAGLSRDVREIVGKALS